MTRSPPRIGQATAWFVTLGSLVVLAALIGLLAWHPGQPSGASGQPLTIYCAAGLRTPLEEIARQYEQETGTPVQMQYGGSQTLLANLELSHSGDLYLPADDSYLDIARKKQLIAETLPVLQMSPVIAVHKGNPHGIHGFDDLLQKDVRIAQANPDAAAVGKLTRDILGKTGQWESLKKHTLVFKPTVNDVANDIKVGAADAGIVWDGTVAQYPELERVDTLEFAGKTAHVGVAVLQSSSNPTAALRFARYLTARDRGLPAFQKEGFRTIDGDPWAETPEIRLFAGAMLRPAIQNTLAEFKEREGVEIITVYNGCGILVADMKTGNHPDAYFACDKSFMSEVNDLFIDPADVSTNQLVILVPRGNPHGIHGLEDLGKAGLKLGIGHEKQCAMGALTQQTLKQGKLQNKVMKNVAVQSPTGDLLVNQLRAGSLDAIIAYISNAKAAGDELESIPIDIPCAIAVQPIALSKDARYPRLTQRLMERLRSEQSKERFEASGFHWNQAAGKK
jgi:molybdate transport system substrate-binding protein